jgi:hypothetical protein
LHFNIVNPSGGYYNNAYFGTIHPDGGGNITMVFNYSGYLTYAGTNYLSQRVTLAPQATFHDGGSILRSGLAAYPDSRWGISIQPRGTRCVSSPFCMGQSESPSLSATSELARHQM